MKPSTPRFSSPKVSTVFFTLIALMGLGVLHAAERPVVYPFDVTLGGQLAVVKGDPTTTIFAEIEKPIAADADFEVSGDPGLLIVNVFPLEANGAVKEGVTPKVIVVPSGTVASMGAFMDGTKLEPGLYGANVVFANATSRVKFVVE